MIRVKNFVAVLIILTCGLINRISDAEQITTDPGSAGFHTVADIRFSIPKGYVYLDKVSNEDTSVLSHKQYPIGIVVKRVVTKLDEKDATSLAAGILQRYLSDKRPFEWKRLEGDIAISKFEVQTERFLGFNGARQALFQFRIVEAKMRKVLVGYFACPSAKPDDKERFDSGLGFDCACWYSQAHIIASITGESYDSIMHPGGIPGPR